ncbi:MAG: tetratricopeptide repeat protein [Cyanobacteria bacterium SBLK]|nr:tetratricopeptide repeat protein [Cyanobacteria bacterium SBLK]
MDESLLETLPLVFNQLIANKTSQERKNIAGLFCNLGSLLWQLPLSNYHLNIEISLVIYQLTLKVFTRGVFPKEWAMAQNNIANIYIARIRGERAENIEKAISAYRLALQVRTRDTFPQDWAMTQNNLANAYTDRIQGEKAENIEKAISAYKLALQVRTRDTFPQDWAGTQNNLANAYIKRIKGEREQNIEKAIVGHELALQVYTRETFPQDWAWTQGIRASAQLAQFELIKKTKYLDEAITALQAALDIVIPKTDTYITINYALARALDHRYKLNRQPEYLEQAILSYHLAAENTPWESHRANYLEKAGDSQYELGVALTQSGQWYKGLAALEAGLKTYRQVDNRLARGDAIQQMARTHYLMGNFDQARTYFRDALRLYLAEKNVIGEAHSRAGLGRLFLRLNYIEDALQELERACELYRQLEDETRLKEIQDVYQLARKVKEKQPL